MKFKKKIAILGPINSRGGREIEAAFIADALMAKYEVSIFSTETVEKNNDLYIVNPSLVIYTKYKSFVDKIKAYLGIKLNYANLQFRRLDRKKNKSLKKVIQQSDLIVIIAQLTSNYTKEIILAAKENNKKVVFRTTGTIPKINLKDTYFSYLKHVSLFLNHSKENSKIFSNKSNLNYKVIDQCVFKEEAIINFQKTKTNPIRKFYCASRLDKNKDIITVIEAFNNLKAYKNLELHIVGDGPELEYLKSKAKNLNIKFYGHLDYDFMIKTISQFDCLIIASIEEAGPYNALEAALLGIPIISTKVGAMKERFVNNNRMWFNVKDSQMLSERIIEYSSYSNQEIKQIQNHYIEIYNANHSKKTIAKAYLDTLSLYL
ncbi:glycosyltransferase [Olleya sp. UBA1516]|uniref:glycosyltransferase n=1 Tax=Olleya sp. UBA1516 TaxID=1947013 RepID=UPI0025FD34B7|nr:glycosyltransferase [Olleya sp. UBA1516]|tara:strand:+ start:187359 stop:188483 length:1125 start_codon:yes stop_codon:yes gene_type:complete